jgi:hypothetical protein
MDSGTIVALNNDGALHYPHIDDSQNGVVVSDLLDGWVVTRWDGMGHVSYLPGWMLRAVDTPECDIETW